MLALNVEPQPGSIQDADNRFYFVWRMGKVPDVVLEIVSDRRGREASGKFESYARIGVPINVIFAPQEFLKIGLLNAYRLEEGEYLPIDPVHLGDTGLGLLLWNGEFENCRETSIL
ncbi:Uma2 family endonuclease [Telmatocola sphagniphila]|uniref:Uma2 family endonuclease n=1 Tax=Telmatocola sphagniphila TaxID=1123043 RepID=A0A8E6EVB6_9BACT|nr:Uma2 family endonuclease [Telmatocola sphagniphila]